jgi:D-arabinose 1-dehydrogenase-like Zn-dependent alcohol dehydrogenase
MRAAWYEQQGPARDVLKVGTMADPAPGPGEVRIRIAVSGINPGSGFEIAERMPLEDIATAHERVEVPVSRGRVIVLP